MKFKIEIDCSNAAFDYCPGVELARIMKIISAQVYGLNSGHNESSPIYDINGNRVGAWQTVFERNEQ